MSDISSEPITADDPELTAYALSELDGAEAARYATAIAKSAELQAVVAEIQSTAHLLSDKLRAEPAVAVSAERRAKIVAQANRPQPAIATQGKPRLGMIWRGAAIAASSVVAGTVGFALFGPQTTRQSQTDHKQLVAQATVATPNSGLASNQPFGEAADHQPATRLSVAYTSTPAAASGPATTPALADVDASAVRVQFKGDGKDLEKTFERDYTPPTGNPAPGITKGTTVTSLSSTESAPRSSINESLSKESNHPEASQPGGTPQPTAEYVVEGQPGKEGRQRPSSDKPALLLLAEESKKRNAPSPSAPNDGKPAEPKGLRSLVTTATPGASVADPFSVGPPKDLIRRGEYPKSGTFVGREKQLYLEKEKESGAVDRLSTEAKPADKQVADLSVPVDKAELESLQARYAIAEIDRRKENEARYRLGWAARELRWHEDPTSNEAYNPIFENAPLSPTEQPLSTFSIDVDTASYANLRRFLQNGQLPPPDAVRIEELVNYFAYQYPQPTDGRPFSVQTDIAACPWQPGHQLVRIGLKGKEIPKEQRAPTNLVFLVDVSGSMSPANKLPLVRESLKTLVGQLDERDKIAIVTYAGQAGVALPSTSLVQRETIIAAINSLGAGGSTNGAAGINTAYDIAAQEFLEKGTNRVILCTDGDFNVGVTSDDALVQMIQTRAKGGVFLSIFGFGMGNLKDAKLEQLADKGNGQYGYIDDQQEANKVFVEEMMGTLVTIAKDVKIQIDFNKETVKSYRLVGYENRVMAAEDFHNDKKDAGEIGSGHTVTALYEIVPNKDLKIDDKTPWLTVKLRYKQPEAAESTLIENPLVGQAGQLKLAPSDFQFAAAVAASGMLLRHSQYSGQANWALVKELAQSGLSYDPNGHRRAFLGLVGQAESLMGQLRPASPPAPDSTVRGKYKSLLRKLNAPEDAEKYGQFNDYGYSDTKTYAGSENLPAGFWVYIAPHWYIWAESTAPQEGSRKGPGL